MKIKKFLSDFYRIEKCGKYKEHNFDRMLVPHLDVKLFLILKISLDANLCLIIFWKQILRRDIHKLKCTNSCYILTSFSRKVVPSCTPTTCLLPSPVLVILRCQEQSFALIWIFKFLVNLSTVIFIDHLNIIFVFLVFFILQCIFLND